MSFVGIPICCNPVIYFLKSFSIFIYPFQAPVGYDHAGAMPAFPAFDSSLILQYE